MISMDSNIVTSNFDNPYQMKNSFKSLYLSDKQVVQANLELSLQKVQNDSGVERDL